MLRASQLVQGIMIGSILAGCAPAARRGTSSAVLADPNLQVWQSELQGTAARGVYARNVGPSTIFLTHVLLSRCVNVRQACGGHQVDLAVRPGATVMALRVMPLNAAQRVTFAIGYRTRSGNINE